MHWQPSVRHNVHARTAWLMRLGLQSVSLKHDLNDSSLGVKKIKLFGAL